MKEITIKKDKIGIGEEKDIPIITVQQDGEEEVNYEALLIGNAEDKEEIEEWVKESVSKFLWKH